MAIVMTPPPAHDSVVWLCLRGCLIFLHRHFPPQPPPSHPLVPSPGSQKQTLPWNCSSIPTLQVPGTALFRGLASLSRVCRAVARIVCVIRIPFNCHRSAASLSNSLKCFSSVPNNCPGLGTDPYFSSPIPLLPQVQVLSCSPSSSFFPSFLYSTKFLHQSIYYFPVVRYSCPLSTGVLQDLLCLKVHS